jgi:hypothetical protein
MDERWPQVSVRCTSYGEEIVEALKSTLVLCIDLPSGRSGYSAAVQQLSSVISNFRCAKPISRAFTT